jgi:undecaprenol kinase/diacylglycerol kinase (ATP)
MAIIVLILATILHAQMSFEDWAIIILLISIIIGMELLNTAIENLVDIISFKYNYNARKIKDIAAAATLTLTLGAVAIGLVIFIPHLIVFFQSF